MQKINRERNNVVKSFRVDGVNVLACESKQELGLLAAEHVQVKIRELLKRRACIRMVFVTAPSQNEFLYNLTLSRENERCRITAFRIEEYCISNRMEIVQTEAVSGRQK